MKRESVLSRRQLRCNVVQNPFIACSRCRRQKLECKIDLGFRRVGKRSRTMEIEQRLVQLEHENEELRNVVNLYRSKGTSVTEKELDNEKLDYTPTLARHNQEDTSDPGASDEAVASLIHLKTNGDGHLEGSASSSISSIRRLEDICLTTDRTHRLFDEFFTRYHPHLPFLHPEKPPHYYYELSPLLFWTIISIASRRLDDEADLSQWLSAPLSRLIWTTVSAVPQNYHVVKAFCLLCTWPSPTSRTSTDPTFMYAGLARQIAIQVGLHQPSHAQDFSRYRLQLRQEDIKDRARTWAVCVIVAQR